MTFTLGFMQDPEVSDVFKILPRFFLQRMLWEIKLTIQILSKDFLKESEFLVNLKCTAYNTYIRNSNKLCSPNLHFSLSSTKITDVHLA